MALKNQWITFEENEKIEKAHETYSYFDKGTTYFKEGAALASFFSVIPLLPKSLVKWLLKKRGYRWLPKSSFFYFRLMSILGVGFKKIFQRKNGLFYFSKKENIKFYLHYLRKIILYKIKKKEFKWKTILKKLKFL